LDLPLLVICEGQGTCTVLEVAMACLYAVGDDAYRQDLLSYLDCSYEIETCEELEKLRGGLTASDTDTGDVAPYPCQEEYEAYELATTDEIAELQEENCEDELDAISEVISEFIETDTD
jgi:hypothetical protein